MHGVSNTGARLLSTGAGLIAAIAVATPALAQVDTAAESPPTDSQVVGDAEAALPGVARVGVASPMRRGAAISAFAGYGFTGAILDLEDTHHRAAGQLGITLRLTEWLGFGVRFDGRYDRHSFTSPAGDETDDGLVGDPRVVIRAAGRVNPTIAIGGQVNLWFPGGDAPDLAPEATSVEATLIGSVVPIDKPYSISLNAGFRLDNSAKTVENADALSLSDRLALGASDSNAVLLGLGATYRAGAVELLGETTYELLVGGDAPSASESPLEVAAGVRVHLSPAMQLQVLGRGRVTSDPSVAIMEPLVPVAPRFGAMAGLHIQFGGPDRATAGPLITGDDDDDDEPIDKPVEPGGIAGRVVSGGAPISDADVKLSGPGVDLTAKTDTEGKFKFEGIDGKVGKVKISVEVEGFKGKELEVPVVAGKVGNHDVEIDRDLPPGQLRGVIRDFRGQPVLADVTILPIGKKVKPGADGIFTVEVPPGDYEVVVEHKNYAPQRREAKVEINQMTILNIDLEKP